MLEKILKALRELDVNNANHWTAEGLPRIETVRLLAGDASLSRDDINAAAVGFSRSNPVLQPATASAPPAPLPTPTPGSETPAAGAPVPPAPVENAPALPIAGATPSSTPEDGALDNGASENEAVKQLGLVAFQDVKEELEHLQEQLSEMESYRVRLDQETARVQKRIDELVSIEAAQPKQDPMAGWKAHIEGNVEKAIAFQEALGDRIKALGALPTTRSELDRVIAQQVQANRKANLSSK